MSTLSNSQVPNLKLTILMLTPCEYFKVEEYTFKMTQSIQRDRYFVRKLRKWKKELARCDRCSPKQSIYF